MRVDMDGRPLKGRPLFITPILIAPSKSLGVVRQV